MPQNNTQKDINKELQLVIGNLIGKDYFKLEFGTLITYAGRGEYIFVEWMPEFGASAILTINNETKTYSRLHSWRIENEKILGQEPTLNDLFRAILSKHNTIWNDTPEYQMVLEETYLTILRLYDLSKSLFNQSPETLQALLKLLK